MNDFFNHAVDVVADVVCANHGRLTVRLDGDRVYLQVVSFRPDTDTGKWSLVKGGKFHLSPHMTDGEIVQKGLQAFLAFEEHEVREHFTFKGKRIYGPHLSLDALMEIADRTEYRNEPQPA